MQDTYHTWDDTIEWVAGELRRGATMGLRGSSSRRPRRGQKRARLVTGRIHPQPRQRTRQIQWQSCWQMWIKEKDKYNENQVDKRGIQTQLQALNHVDEILPRERFMPLYTIITILLPDKTSWMLKGQKQKHWSCDSYVWISCNSPDDVEYCQTNKTTGDFQNHTDAMIWQIWKPIGKNFPPWLWEDLLKEG